jgi:hypothetical protein
MREQFCFLNTQHVQGGLIMANRKFVKVPQTHVRVVDGTLARKTADNFYGDLVKVVSTYVFWRPGHEVTTKIGGTDVIGQHDQQCSEMAQQALPIIFEPLLKLRVEGKPIEVTTPVTNILKSGLHSMIMGVCANGQNFTIRAFVLRGTPMYIAQIKGKYHSASSNLISVVNDVFNVNGIAELVEDPSVTCLEVAKSYKAQNFNKVKVSSEHFGTADIDASVMALVEEEYLALITQQNADARSIESYLNNEDGVVVAILEKVALAVTYLKNNNNKVVSINLWVADGNRNAKVVFKTVKGKYRTIVISMIQGVIRFGLIEKTKIKHSGRRLPVVTPESPTEVELLFVTPDDNQEGSEESNAEGEEVGVSSDTPQAVPA